MARPLPVSMMAVTLAGIGAFVYTSPAPPTPQARSEITRAAQGAAARTAAVHDRAVAAAGRDSRGGPSSRRGRDRLDGPARRAAAPPTGKVRTVTVHRVRTVTRTARAITRAARGHPSRVPTCSSFLWQQDAQAAYVQNLADPYGLDGPPGPADDDGVACSLLPVDPARPASTPAGARRLPPPPPPGPEPLPDTPSIDELLAPERNYFGVSTPQAPYDFKDFQIFAGAARKIPNMVEFFQGWDREYPRDQIIELWRRGALPVLSWEPRPTAQPMGPDSDNTTEPDYTLRSIIDGSHDEYIDRFATSVRDLGLPVAIRFAHEMNGNWFPWSEEKNGNSTGEFVEAWRHVHDRFDALGATNAIWIWSPNVTTGRPSVRLAPLYPGDDYVDWFGLVGYYRRVYYDDKGKPKAPTFENTYGSSLAELRPIASKPILFTEVGATEVGGNKPAWITSLFGGIADNPDIIGFVWFDQSVNGTDWRIESSSAASEAFAEGVASDRYGAGRIHVPRS